MHENGVSRRRFLAQAAAIAASSALPRWTFAQPAKAIAIPGKDAGLVTLSAAPLVLETPLSLLEKDAITPKSLLFVRNNQDWAEALNLQPRPLDGWSIEVTGLVEKPVIVPALELAKLEQQSIEMVLQCSGNGRSLFSKAAPTEGTQWGRGGLGNVVFRGVPLRLVFEKFGVKPRPEARFVTANGRDEPSPMKDDFEHSLPAADVLQRSILALEINGEPLPALHGGPVRLVTPGYFGTMQVKWLSQLRLEAEETKVSHQLPRYRLPNEPIPPGTEYKFTFENSRPNYRMNVKSTILSPLLDARLPAGDATIRGVAFNDGAAAIDAVLVSVDRGVSWTAAKLTAPMSLFAWTRWEAVLRLDRPGQYEIWSRAIDRLGRSQPLDGSVFWNPHGYEWNGVDKVPVNVA